MVFSYFAEWRSVERSEISHPDFLLNDFPKESMWSHGIYNVVPFRYPSRDEDYAERIEPQCVQRADRYGIKVYLYVNEPRAMPEEFFDSQERKELIGVKGGQGGNLYSLCTSNRIVHDWLRDSFEKVFSSVPGLGGVFTITASENLTNCASHGRHTQ